MYVPEEFIVLEESCTEDTKLQLGDWIRTKHSYCDVDDGRCTNETPCDHCLSMANVFVISGVHSRGSYNDYYFGGFGCSRDGGCLINDSKCHLITRDKDVLEKDPYASAVEEFSLLRKKYPHEITSVARPVGGLIQIAARLVQYRHLNELYEVCENQKTIKATVLQDIVDRVSEKIKSEGCAVRNMANAIMKEEK